MRFASWDALNNSIVDLPFLDVTKDANAILELSAESHCDLAWIFAIAWTHTKRSDDNHK